jgi:hypothetical protein
LDGFIPVQYEYSQEIESAIASAYGADALTLVSKLQEARQKLKSLGSDEIMSTRKVEQACRLYFCAGWKVPKILKHFTYAWPEGLAEQVFGAEAFESKAG